MIFGNVIWAPNWPFWYAWLPVSAFVGFVAELFVFHFYERNCHSLRHSLRLLTVGNIASFLVGFVGLALIAAALPGREFMAPQPRGYPPWQDYHVIVLQFLTAYFLSVFIEFGIYRRMSRSRTIHRLAAATFMSNLASYAIISTGYIGLWLPRFTTPDEWFVSLFDLQLK